MLIDLIASDETTTLQDLEMELHPHTGMVLRCGSQSLLVVADKDGVLQPIKGKMRKSGISPRSAEQSLYMYYLNNPSKRKIQFIIRET